MPRPTAQEAKTTKGAWRNKSKLEFILVALVLCIIIIIVVLLVFLLAKKQVDFTQKYCNTTTCLREASKVNSYVDPQTSPCEDFYQFSCGTFLKNAHGDEDLGLSQSIPSQASRQLFQAYIEPIKEDDHKMVIAAKKLFRACMNETLEMEEDNLQTMKNFMKALGGWPVLEGSEWKEETFDWVNATYKIRELGLDHSVFLELKILPHPDNNTKYIYSVETPDVWDYGTPNFDKTDFMTEVAQLFGVVDIKLANQEMVEAQAFKTLLQREVHNQYGNGFGTRNKYVVSKYQQKSTTVNWFEFINTVASPPAEISKDDYVLFPPPKILRSWTNLISNTPKRTQANYMIINVIKAVLPYLTEDLRTRGGSIRIRDRRKEFCLRTTQNRFILSPIDIMCDRKYLPKEKKEKVEEIVQNIKTELLIVLEKINWVNETDKQSLAKKAKAIEVVVGTPGDYFGDTILDNLDVDMVRIEKETFLSLLAQANRNRQTALYQQIHKTVAENLHENWVYKNGATLPMYSEEAAVLHIPVVTVTGNLYDENRPSYINYGLLGTQVAIEFSGVLNKYLLQEKSILKCVEKEMKELSWKSQHLQTDIVAHRSIGEQISYLAYQKWTKNHGNEKHLIGIERTPMQMFWIAATSVFCQPINPSGSFTQVFAVPEDYSGIISATLRNNPQLAIDFECPKESKMNPANRCQIV